MDIEDDDSNSNSSIYVNTPVMPPSTHPHSTLAHSTQLPHRSSLLSQFQQPSAVSVDQPFRVTASHAVLVVMCHGVMQFLSPIRGK